MKIEFNKVTWYSKILTLIIFIGVVLFAFYLGRSYEVDTHISEVVYVERVVEVERVVDVEKDLSIEGLPRSFTSYGGYVFFQGEIIEGADPETIQAKKDWRTDIYHNYNSCNSCYIYDDDQVWFHVINQESGESFFSEVSISSLENFEVIESYEYRRFITNGEQTFSGVIDFSGVDVENLKDIDSSNYLSDGKKIVTHGGILKDVDINTFQIVGIDKYHAKDKSHVYLGASILENFSPETFQVLNRRYKKDHDTVMYIHKGECAAVFKWQTVEEADAPTFELIQEGADVSFAKDKNYIYEGALPIVGSDPSTVEYSGGQLTDSTGRIYHTGNLFIGGC